MTVDPGHALTPPTTDEKVWGEELCAECGLLKKRCDEMRAIFREARERGETMTQEQLHIFTDGEGDFILAKDKEDLMAFLREEQVEEEYLSDALLDDGEEWVELPDDALIEDEEAPREEWKTCAHWCTVYGRGYFGNPKT